ncbi:PGF-CTERM sorting domain-containing protein [Methanoculleus taiwanensis]|uniref:PGF-CTERM sorting domain-containing protein n=1 Tax=Methanoculleus taiwanensis TaxID=1550565 RepID=UPI0013E8B489|nr:PGF-CTERM sorting domain-containing protein [Methanoculleus taiwanensis]
MKLISSVILLIATVLLILGMILAPFLADPGGGADDPAIIVAASGSSAAEKAKASYICDGVNDHVEIQAALTALPAGGGTVRLAAGTYNLAGNIEPRAKTVLEGAGPDATTLAFPKTGGIRIYRPSVTLEGFTVIGVADILIAESHARVRDVTMTVDNSRIGAFYVWAANTVIEDTVFENCRAVNCGRYGFLNSGEGEPRLVKNIKYINCEAINCGRYSSVSTGPWVTGFDIVEKNDIDGAEIIGCYAEGNQESGFHLEGFSYLNIKNVRFQDCVSVNNAQKGKDASMFGAGYTVSKGVTFENCTSENNKHGFLINGASVRGHDVSFIRCTDTGSDYGFTVDHGSGFTLEECEAIGSAFRSLTIDRSHNISVEAFKSRPSEKGAGTAPVGSGADDHHDVLIQDSYGVTMSGEIITSRPHALTVTGSESREVTLHDTTVISRGQKDIVYGIFVNNDVSDAGTIRIKDSTIRTDADGKTFNAGIENRAGEKVKVSNVLVTGAKTAYVNCDILAEAEVVSPTPTEQPGFGIGLALAGLAVLFLLRRRK